MNPLLRDTIKEELQKLLNVNFIYPISNNVWVSPLVIVPKKNGKQHICVHYHELNKATRNDHFPLPFIDQVLDLLVGKQFFSFIDGFSGYTKIQIALKDQDKTTSNYPWGTFAYRVLPFGLCSALATFQWVVLGIFSDLTHDCVEIYMDNFTVYAQTFEEDLCNLEKVLNNGKCYMLQTEDIVFGNHIFVEGIKVDFAKIEVIVNHVVRKTQKEVRSFLGHVGYYHCFIEHFTKITSPLFSILVKDTNFN